MTLVPHEFTTPCDATAFTSPVGVLDISMRTPEPNQRSTRWRPATAHMCASWSLQYRHPDEMARNGLPGDVPGACGRPNAANAKDPTEHIDLDLSAVDLMDALRAVAMKARVSLFADPDIKGSVSIRVRSTPWKDVLAKIAAEHGLRIEMLSVHGASRPSVWISNQTSSPAPRRDFTGETMEANFSETPIRDAARTFAHVSRINVVVDDDVQISVTLRMRNIPWDLALYHLAQKYKLRIVRDPTSLRIAR